MTDYIDGIINSKVPETFDKVLVGIYLEPKYADILASLGKKGGRGAKSEIVNLALHKLFKDKGLI
ncbi:hypothetical protein L1N85_10630 [Paenibacillus alkaliterrae]|uniref:hypothetical protein n=1 Tax=Paenibacillus alkaliterrae TaxID=320909 RepID=UPI001F2D71FB|nr:hypothetical protein [Paenibacillus alkaliterrae]MCF2938891.1 hypothetical protein [Paenibacillus alkaliterrae]